MIGYADDAFITTTGVDLPSIIDLTEAGLKKVIEWGKNNCLSFNESKTSSIIFRKKLLKKLPRKVIMNNFALEWAKSVTYLGVELDEKLTFNLHIQNKIKKAKRFLLKLRNSIGKVWGPTPMSLLLYAYKNMIIPSLAHGAIVWYKSCENASIKKKLAQLNRLICSCLMPLRQSVPTSGLETALNIMPLHLCMAKSALNTYVRVRKIVKPTWDQIGSNSKRGHLLRCQKDLSNLGITLVDEDRDFYLNIDR